MQHKTGLCREPPAIEDANPLDSRRARNESRYIDPSGGRLRYRSRPVETPSRADQAAHAALQALVLDPSYPCVMARSVFNRDAFRMAHYGALGDPACATMLCHDLYAFNAEFAPPVNGAVSFVACFEGPAFTDEAAFEVALWRQLQAVHDVDKRHFSWAGEVGSAPDDPNFSFSVGSRAFFLIGMHPGSSRIARRTPFPAIVFNLHEQFVELRATGKFDGVRDKVQTRDEQLQGTINPMSADFGARSEAAQYSGRAVDREWACPFSTA